MVYDCGYCGYFGRWNGVDGGFLGLRRYFGLCGGCCGIVILFVGLDWDVWKLVIFFWGDLGKFLIFRV